VSSAATSWLVVARSGNLGPFAVDPREPGARPCVATDRVLNNQTVRPVIQHSAAPALPRESSRPGLAIVGINPGINLRATAENAPQVAPLEQAESDAAQPLCSIS
jgi:hypothetical protein